MEDKFQTNLEVIRIYDENNHPPQVTKVGILPFLPQAGGVRILLMKPQAEAKYLGEPVFQLAKGTRRINVNGNWCDMREDDLRHADPFFHEPLVDTALREGREEVGLKPSNIIRLYDAGGFEFISVSRGVKKPLHMFAAEIKDARDFVQFETSTAETCWMTLPEFTAVGREDHVGIGKEIIMRLEKHLNTKA